MKGISMTLMCVGFAISAYNYGKLQYNRGWKDSAANVVAISRNAIAHYDEKIRNYCESSQI